MNFGGPTSEDEAIRIIRRFLDAGGNFIDTANVYNQGRSEEIVGKAIKGKRDSVVLATKVHFPMGDGPNDYGNSRKHIMHQIEQSLRRLGTDYIDIYYIQISTIYIDRIPQHLLRKRSIPSTIWFTRDMSDTLELQLSQHGNSSRRSGYVIRETMCDSLLNDLYTVL